MLNVAIPPRLNDRLPNGAYTAFCIRRESAVGFIYSDLSSSDEVLCASGGAGVGVSNTSNGSEVKLPTHRLYPAAGYLNQLLKENLNGGLE